MSRGGNKRASGEGHNHGSRNGLFRIVIAISLCIILVALFGMCSRGSSNTNATDSDNTYSAGTVGASSTAPDDSPSQNATSPSDAPASPLKQSELITPLSAIRSQDTTHWYVATRGDVAKDDEAFVFEFGDGKLGIYYDDSLELKDIVDMSDQEVIDTITQHADSGAQDAGYVRGLSYSAKLKTDDSGNDVTLETIEIDYTTANESAGMEIATNNAKVYGVEITTSSAKLNGMSFDLPTQLWFLEASDQSQVLSDTYSGFTVDNWGGHSSSSTMSKDQYGAILQRNTSNTYALDTPDVDGVEIN